MLNKIKFIFKRIKDFFGFKENATFGDVVFYFIFSCFICVFLFYFTFTNYLLPIDRYLYIEKGVYLRDYSDLNCRTDQYYENIEQYKQTINSIDN